MLSFIIPAPDTKAAPTEIYKAVSEQIEDLDTDWELIFIDHGQCEKTWLHIQSLVRQDPKHVRAYIFSETQNRSAALALGYRESRGDLVFTLESDQQDDPRELTRFLQRIEWENGSLPSDSNSSAENKRWQNILPRGVLRGTAQTACAAA